MSRITVCAESDFPSGESFKGTQGRVSARLPSPPDAQGGLANIDVAGTIGPVTVATVDTVTANQTIKARADCFGRGNRFNEYPHLDHIAGFPVVGGVIEAGGDDDPQGVLVEDETIHREPPTKNSATQ